MITTQQIADAMIRDSRGIITVPGKLKNDTIEYVVKYDASLKHGVKGITRPRQASSVEAVFVPHVMSVAAYNERFGAKGEGK